MLPYQRKAYDAIKRDLWGIEPDGSGPGSYLDPKGKHRKFIPELHRKNGKSTLCGIIASELCRQKESGRVFWAAETQRQVTLFLKPIMDEVTADCPERLKPRWYKQDGMWVWPETEAQIIIGGCEDESKCNRLRGPACDLFIIDEAGQIDLLDYLYTSVVLWMLSRTGGRVILPSTPATTPAHPFTAMCALAEAGDGGWLRQSVYDSEAFPPDVLEELARECRGTGTPQWKREALCLRVIDESRAIVPEFSADGAEDAVCMPLCTRCGAHFDKHDDQERCADGQLFAWALGRPEYFDTYVSADPGWYPDLFALLLAYRDFRRALTVIEDELEFSKPTTEDVADGLKAKELLRWGGHFEAMAAQRLADQAKPYKRVSDVDLQIIHDLRKLHSIDFLPTRKDDKDAQVNETRLQVKHRKLAIHPRCKKLRAHLRAGIKTKNGKDWERIEGFGHFDFCLIGGTMVQAERGQVAIENVRVGDMVWTRAGLRRVLAAACTGTHPTWQVQSGAGTLTGTAEHNVWTANAGWKPLASLTSSDILCTWVSSESASRSSSTGASTAGTRTPPSASTASTTQPATGYRSIERSGSSIAATSRQAWTSTTSTRTRSTTTSATWNWLSTARTAVSTWVRRLWQSCARTFGALRLSPRYGIALQPASCGTHSARLSAAVHEPGSSSAYASNAAPASWLRSACRPSVATAVRGEAVAHAGSTASSESASCAEPSTALASTRAPRTAPSAVLRVTAGPVAKVYDLTVEGEPEFFANGVLVHNCAALIYLIRNIDTQHNPYPDLRFATGPNEWANPRAKAAAMAEVPEQYRDLAKAWPGGKGAR